MENQARGHHRLYYEDLGKSHDDLLRCKDCRRLVLYQNLIHDGHCPKCGCRRMSEITTLTVFEWLRIRLGLLSFPYRQEFLKEFNRE